MKKYKLSLYEIELILLYKKLKTSKPHLARVESEIEKIIQNNKEFKDWKDLLEEIKNESNS